MKRSMIVIAIFILLFGWVLFEFIVNSDDKELEEEVINSEDTEEFSVSSDTNINEDGGEEQTSGSGEEGLEVGNMAPDIPITTLDGEEVRLSEFRGKQVMLNFWATWCPPCRAEMPDMEKFHQDTDIEIVAVNLIDTEANLKQVQDFIDEYDLTFSILLDEGNTAATIYKIQPIPTTYLINSDGTIHNKAFGALNYELMIQEFEKMQ